MDNENDITLGDAGTPDEEQEVVGPMPDPNLADDADEALDDDAEGDDEDEEGEEEAA